MWEIPLIMIVVGGTAYLAARLNEEHSKISRISRLKNNPRSFNEGKGRKAA